jgi:hypothetical protein
MVVSSFIYAIYVKLQRLAKLVLAREQTSAEYDGAVGELEDRFLDEQSEYQRSLKEMRRRFDDVFYHTRLPRPSSLTPCPSRMQCTVWTPTAHLTFNMMNRKQLPSISVAGMEDADDSMCQLIAQYHFDSSDSDARQALLHEFGSHPTSIDFDGERCVVTYTLCFDMNDDTSTAAAFCRKVSRTVAYLRRIAARSVAPIGRVIYTQQGWADACMVWRHGAMSWHFSVQEGRVALATMDDYGLRMDPTWRSVTLSERYSSTPAVEVGSRIRLGAGLHPQIVQFAVWCARNVLEQPRYTVQGQSLRRIWDHITPGCVTPYDERQATLTHKREIEDHSLYFLQLSAQK